MINICNFDLHKFGSDLASFGLALKTCKDIGSDLVSHDSMRLVVSLSEEAHGALTAQNNSWIRAEQVAAKRQLDKEVADLVVWAYGVKDQIQAWSSKLPGKASMEAIVKCASDAGMLEDKALDQLPIHISKTKKALDDWTTSQELDGTIVDQSVVDHAMSVVRRGVLTDAEVGIMKAWQQPLDKEAKRLTVTNELRKLRGVEVSERAVLLHNMFRWSFQAVTGR